MYVKSIFTGDMSIFAPRKSSKKKLKLRLNLYFGPSISLQTDNVQEAVDNTEPR